MSINTTTLRFNYYQLLAFYDYDEALVSLLFESFSEKFPSTRQQLLLHFKSNNYTELAKSLESLKTFALNFQCSELVQDIVIQEKLLSLGEAPVEIKLYSILYKSQVLIQMIYANQKQSA